MIIHEEAKKAADEIWHEWRYGESSYFEFAVGRIQDVINRTLAECLDLAEEFVSEGLTAEDIVTALRLKLQPEMIPQCEVIPPPNYYGEPQPHPVDCVCNDCEKKV